MDRLSFLGEAVWWIWCSYGRPKIWYLSFDTSEIGTCRCAIFQQSLSNTMTY